MKKSTIVPLIVFLALAGGLYYLLSSFHIDVFSGTYTKFDELYQKDTVLTMSNISLADVHEGRASLDTKSWMVAAAVIAGFPLLVALLVRFRIKRKARKKLAATQATPTPTNETVA